MRREPWNGRGRIDARSHSNEGTAEGVRGAHRDTSGNLIGGYSPDRYGTPFGSKVKDVKPRGLAAWYANNPSFNRTGGAGPQPAKASVAAAPNAGTTTQGGGVPPATTGRPPNPGVAPSSYTDRAAAGSQTLRDRQALDGELRRTVANGLPVDQLQGQAEKLGVSPDAFEKRRQGWQNRYKPQPVQAPAPAVPPVAATPTPAAPTQESELLRRAQAVSDVSRTLQTVKSQNAEPVSDPWRGIDPAADARVDGADKPKPVAARLPGWQTPRRPSMAPGI